MVRSVLASVALLSLVAAAFLAGCSRAPAARQALGADCKLSLDRSACAEGLFCARPEYDRGEQARYHRSGLSGLTPSTPLGRCARLPAVGEQCTFFNRDCVAGATCQFAADGRIGVCRADH